MYVKIKRVYCCSETKVTQYVRYITKLLSEVSSDTTMYYVTLKEYLLHLDVEWRIRDMFAEIPVEYF